MYCQRSEGPPADVEAFGCEPKSSRRWWSSSVSGHSGTTTRRRALRPFAGGSTRALACGTASSSPP
jgi:hypothetical protein